MGEEDRVRIRCGKGGGLLMNVLFAERGWREDGDGSIPTDVHVCKAHMMPSMPEVGTCLWQTAAAGGERVPGGGGVGEGWAHPGGGEVVCGGGEGRGGQGWWRRVVLL